MVRDLAGHSYIAASAEVGGSETPGLLPWRVLVLQERGAALGPAWRVMRSMALLGGLSAVLAGIERHRCTGLPGVPSTFAQLLRSGLLDKHDTSSLRYVTQAGAAMAPALGARVRAAFPNARLHVMYGQTEATARIAYVPPESLAGNTDSIGIAIAGGRLRLVDETGAEVARAGEAGEQIGRAHV